MMVSFLDIRVRREAVLMDAINQLTARQNDLKKPLRVTFISAGVDEEAQVDLCYWFPGCLYCTACMSTSFNSLAHGRSGLQVAVERT